MLDDLRNESYDIRDDGGNLLVKFKIGKLNALEGFNLIERIRVAMGPKLTEIETDNNLKSLLTAIMTLPRDLIEDVQKTLFAKVVYERPNVTQKTAIALTVEQWPQAFAQLEPIHIYELTVRALAVNFMKSFSILQKYQVAK